MASSGTHNLMRMALSWTIAAGIGVVGIARFDEIRSALGLKLDAEDFGMHQSVQAAPVSAARGDRAVVIKAGRNGHFEVTARINGRPVDVMVDTGASAVALTYEDAEAAGIFPRDSDFKHRVNTANGVARVAAVTLDTVSIDDITVRNVRAMVAERGRLQQTLLGMTFLGQLTKAEMSRGTLTLQE